MDMDYLNYLLFFIKMKLWGKVNLAFVENNVFRTIYRHAIKFNLERDLIHINGYEYLSIKNIRFIYPNEFLILYDASTKIVKYNIKKNNVLYLKDYKKMGK